MSLWAALFLVLVTTTGTAAQLWFLFETGEVDIGPNGCGAVDFNILPLNTYRIQVEPISIPDGCSLSDFRTSRGFVTGSGSSTADRICIQFASGDFGTTRLSSSYQESDFDCFESQYVFYPIDSSCSMGATFTYTIERAAQTCFDNGFNDFVETSGKIATGVIVAVVIIPTVIIVGILLCCFFCINCPCYYKRFQKQVVTTSSAAAPQQEMVGYPQPGKAV